MKQQHIPQQTITNQPTELPNPLRSAMDSSWDKISPCWPLRNIIAVNPLRGFEKLDFENALSEANKWFQQPDIPTHMATINRHTIKWLQAFFDHGQATIGIPGREHGFLKSLLLLLPHDNALSLSKEQKAWLSHIPSDPEKILSLCLFSLKVSPKHYESLLSLMLTTLPGWAAYVEYRSAWADTQDAAHPYPVNREEYLAFRILLTHLLWSNASAELLAWHESNKKPKRPRIDLTHIIEAEKAYQAVLTQQLSQPNHSAQPTQPKAQFIFCIDVRSEPFRHALEQTGNYDSYGFAGFFGAPISIKNTFSDEHYDSCPVLVKPKHHVAVTPKYSRQAHFKHQLTRLTQSIYQSMKYTFSTPFALVDITGSFSGLLIAAKSFLPKTVAKTTSQVSKKQNDFSVYSTDTIPFSEQVTYAYTLLKNIGLTDNFSDYVFLCGHGSTTTNNPHATALDCGACAGREGAPNANILTHIMNDPDVRKALLERGVHIPSTTHFIAAKHNTTTDAVTLYDQHLKNHPLLADIKADLRRAQQHNCASRARHMVSHHQENTKAAEQALFRSQDWSQLRAEWGLATNAGFIVGPRYLTRGIALEGRCFLHSYDWQSDTDLQSLTSILTAPVIVAQWINAQYFFSSTDNTAFGSGSKTTQNITGKLGIMQGNASDLMHGLPLESVFKNDHDRQHEALRLSVIIYAPPEAIMQVIDSQPSIRQLVVNGWIYLLCMDPSNHTFLTMSRSLAWEPITA